MLLAASAANAEPPDVLCTAAANASGACIDILTRLPDPSSWFTATIPLTDDEYLVKGVAYEGRLPVAAGPTGAPAHHVRGVMPGSPVWPSDVPVFFVAKYTKSDALAQWLVPFYATRGMSVARGPGGTIYVLAYTYSSRWPEPPMSAADYLPDLRSALVVLAPDGSVVRAEYVSRPDDPAYFPSLVATDSRGNPIMQEGRDLVRRELTSLTDLGRAPRAGTILVDDGIRPEIVSQAWVDEGPSRIDVWRRDDFAVVAAFTLPGGLAATDAVRRGDSDLYVTFQANADVLSALAPCDAGGAEARDDDLGVFLAKLSIATQQIEWIRCVGRWRYNDMAVDLLDNGQLLVSAATHPLHLGESRALGPSLFRSDSAGRAWQSVNAGLGEGRMVTLAVDPTDARVAYASTTDGVKKTIDGGATWRTITPSIWQPYTAISVNPLAPDEVWALGLPASAWSLMHSDDGGATWAQLARAYRRGSYNDPPIPFPTVFDAADPTRVWSNGASDVSSDRGATWERWTSGPPPAGFSWATFAAGSPLGRRYGIGLREGGIDRAYLSAVGDGPWTAGTGRTLYYANLFALDPHHPERAFVSSSWEPRVDATLDGGATWFDLGGPAAPAVEPLGLAAGSQRAGADTSLLLWGTHQRTRQPWRTVLFGSDDSGRTWDVRTTCDGCTSFVRAPSDPDIVYGFGTSAMSRVYSWWSLDTIQVEQQVIVPSAGGWGVEGMPGMQGVISGFAPDTDEDDDGLPNGWERDYGVEASDPVGDPDGDGLTNAQEWQAGSHPVGRHVYACAEAGTTDTFATRIDMFNPDTTRAARVLLRYSTSDDVDARALVYVPAGATRYVELGDTHSGFEGGEHPVLIESDLPLATTRTMTWGHALLTHTRVGQHAGACVPPAPAWHFAEGSTGAGLQTFFVLLNPSAQATTVVATFLRTAPLAPLTREYALPAGARLVVWANLELAPDTGDVAATFASIDATPVVVERSMYTASPAAPFSGGGTSANGVVAPARAWWFAEGVSGGGFESYVLLANPNATPSTVRVTYADEAGAVVEARRVVGPGSRLTMRAADDVPTWRTFTTRVDVVEGAAIVAERASWWTTVPGMPWWSAPTREGHASNGVSALASAWVVAGGSSAPLVTLGSLPVWPDSYLLVGKWSDAATTALVQLHFADGSVLEQVVALEQGSRRVTVPIQSLFGGDALGLRAFAVTLVAADPSAQLVVELSQYRSSTEWWSAGTSMTGTPMVR